MLYYSRPARQSIVALAASAAVALAVTACGDDEPDLPPPPASPPSATAPADQGPDLTTAEQAAVDEARQLADEFLAAYVEEARIGEPFDTEMGPVIGGRPLEYTTGEVTQQVQTEFVRYYEDGVVFDGELAWEFLAAEAVDLDRVVNEKVVPEVQLRYCIDATNWRATDTTEPGSRYLTSLRLVWFDDDNGTRTEGWRVSGWEDREAEEC